MSQNNGFLNQRFSIYTPTMIETCYVCSDKLCHFRIQPIIMVLHAQPWDSMWDLV